MQRGILAEAQRKLPTKDIHRAWEAFLSDKHVPQNSVRNVVLESWKRSKNQLVDPGKQKAPLIDEQLEREQRKHREFLDAAQPVLRDMGEFLGNRDTVLVLCNAQGIILSTQGKRGGMEAAKEVNILPGGMWHERYCGTNGVGTALATNTPVQIYGSEHYCQGAKPWTCATSLVRDPVDDTVLGAIDISYFDDDLDCKALPLVVFAARRIEAIIYGREMIRQRWLLEKYLEHGAETQRDGILLLDRRGRLIRANDHASRALAAQGIHADLAYGSVIRYMDEDANPHQVADIDILKEKGWVRPVTHKRERIGSIVFVPYQTQRIVSSQSGNRLPAKEKDAKIHSYLDNHLSPAMREAASQARQVARVEDIPVLLQGETGTGKEILAHAIHSLSSRRQGPFITVNCGAIPRELLASELFGHCEGAFTGARRGGHAGKFEQADGGTILLDELGELPVELQPYLLRVLENNEVIRLGSNSCKTVDVRVIAATNRNLEEALDAGEFREDLYYRFSVNIFLPPLRERSDDFDQYLDCFLENAVEELGVRKYSSEELRMALRRYNFPGNLRELKNIVRHMTVISEQEVLTPADLPDYVRRRLAESTDDTLTSGQETHNLKATEARMIAAALKAENGSRSRAAQRLGISRTTLYRRLREADRNGLM